MVTVALVVSALVSFILGALVYFEQRKVISSLYFFLTMVGTTMWSIGIALFLSTNSHDLLLASATAYYVAAALIAWATFLFSYFFTGHSKFDIGAAASTLPFIVMGGILVLWPNVLIEEVSVGESNTATLVPSFYLVYIVYFVAYYVSALYFIVKRYLNEKGIAKKHYMYVLMAYSSAGIIGMLFNLFLPAVGNYTLIWAGPLGLLIFVPIVYLAIARFGLFDIRQTVVRTVAYIFSLSLLAAIYYVLAYIVSVLIFGGETSSTVSISPINILLALLLAFIFQPIKNFFDRATDRIFFRDRYNSDEFYARFSEVLTSTTDLRTLLQRAAIEVGTTLKADQAFFFVQYHETRRITAGTSHHTDFPHKDTRDINEYITSSGSEVIVRDILPTDFHLKRILTSHKIAILMPLVRHKEVLGYLCLGEQRASGYTGRDIKVLNTISDELVIAIQNSLSVQEVRDINVNLEQRIEAATAELRTSNARLKRLDAAKDEFLSMASHQLRTPLTSVKGYLSMILDGDMGKLTPMQKQVLEEAFSSSERMVHLIHDFLNVSRLQTGKFMLELSDIRLDKLVEQEVKSLESVAKSHSMTLDFVNAAGEVTMRLDDTKMRQVVMNYIDNAIYYSHPDTTITISLEKADSEVVLKVKDTGIGVPKSEQEHLFGKFYRATNARKQRPDGTGVGIYLAKRVVTALGGDIVFESKEGKGSTFGFRLPIKQGESLLKDKTKQLEDQPA